MGVIKAMRQEIQLEMEMLQEKWISKELLNRLTQIAVTRVYWQKEFIYRQEEKANWCYYLKKGQVKIFVSSENGTEKTLAIYKEQMLFGEAAFFAGHPRTTNAIATKESEVLVISKENILQCFGEKPMLAWSIMSSLSQTVRLLSMQINEMSFLSAKKRLLQFLISEYEKGQGVISHTQEEIGALMGVSRVTISRELRELKKAGILEIHYGKLKIKRIEELKQMFAEEKER